MNKKTKRLVVFTLLILISLSYSTTALVTFINPVNSTNPVVIGGLINFSGNTTIFGVGNANITNFTVLINSTSICSARNTSASQSHFSCIGDTSNILNQTSNPSLLAYNLTFRFSNNSIQDTLNTLVSIDNLVPQVGDYLDDVAEDGAIRNINNLFIGVDSIDDTYFGNTTISLYNSTSILNSTTIYVRSTNQNFTFNVSFDLGITDGIYFFNITTIDNATNKNSTSERNITIDRANPTSAITSVPTEYTYFGSSASFSCSSHDAGTGINDTIITIVGPGADETVRKIIYSDSGTITTGSNNDIDQLGTYKATCTVKDYAGNSLQSGEKEFTITSTPSNGGGGKSNQVVEEKSDNITSDKVKISDPDQLTSNISGIEENEELDSSDTQSDNDLQDQESNKSLKNSWMVILILIILIVIVKIYLNNQNKVNK